MIGYLLIGVAAGILTGVPIGPVNVAVIDTAYRHHLKRAIAVGIGGAVADMAYAWVGILGVGPMLKTHPNVPPILYLCSGLVLTVYGAITIRTRQSKMAAVKKPETPQGAGYWWAGFAVGVALILLNPAAIITWVVIVGSVMADVTYEQGLSAALGVGLGSAAWFTLVAYLADHGKRVLGDRALWITRIVGMLLMGYGVFLLARAAHFAFTHWL